MLIGIDFDNTIAKYDEVFIEVAVSKNLIDSKWHGSKKSLKKIILSFPDGDKKWMSLQGKVYGKFMKKADLMPDFKNFLLHCKLEKINLCVVSHKTEYGHFDSSKTNLRKEAMKWMAFKNLFDPSQSPLKKEDIYFAETRSKKVTKINELKCDYFIDDLNEVFQENHFSKKVKKILFDDHVLNKKVISLSDWKNINSHFFGKDKLSFNKLLFKSILGVSPNSLTKVKGRGNSKVFKGVIGKKKYALKIYPNKKTDIRNRIETEFKSLQLLRENNIRNIPLPIKLSKDFNSAIYSWVEGKHILSPKEHHLDQSISLIKKLKKISNNKNHKFILASESCLSLEDLDNQIKNRLISLELISKKNKALESFLKETFKPLLKKIKEDFYILWPAESISKDLIIKKRILSPSDYGFHNSLEDSKNIVHFLDFDYFGWDDPVKLAADFYWHPGMKLNKSIKESWIKEMKSIFGTTDNNFLKRLESALPIYGLRWILIILNIYSPEVLERRMHASGILEQNISQIKKLQLTKADKLANQIIKYLSEQPY